MVSEPDQRRRDGTESHTLTTARLRLLAATPALLRAELRGDRLLAAALDVDPLTGWPPEGGEYDRDAIQFFLTQLEQGGPSAAGWSSWYVTYRPPGAGHAVLVANAGYFGPPDAEHSVEIGYSVSAQWRNRGFASEFVGALCANAVQRSAVQRVVARVRPDNAASLAVLRRNAFEVVEPLPDGLLLLQWTPPGRADSDQATTR